MQELLPSQPAVEINYHRTETAALQSVGRAFQGLRGRPMGPTVVILSSPLEGDVRRALPPLAEWPTVSAPAGADAAAFPALAWQAPALRAVLGQTLRRPDWLQARLRAARYAHLPLGSIGPDWLLDAADALFARQLWAAGHLLWTPDAAGAARDAAAARGALITRPPDRAEELLNEEILSASSEITVPGVYRTVCFEIRLVHLAVNAVLEVGAH